MSQSLHHCKEPTLPPCKHTLWWHSLQTNNMFKKATCAFNDLGDVMLYSGSKISEDLICNFLCYTFEQIDFKTK